ncbi:MAG TPA: hypothetical protein PKH24_05255 [Sedimentisphaerales bacterium]|jgi:hypothetical protein|nr:hypothetical protein [Sedimentisphaerales bacterium]HNU29044.1 hypothetical protein [Sedimentisphaerales bacterium]
MRHRDHTDIGGTCDQFLSTEWSVIRSIQQGEDADDILIGRLTEQYWKPVYCYLRHKGLDNETSKDLTQGFFQQIVLGRDLIRRADRTRGSFRRLLLTALERYLRSEHRREIAWKRHGKGWQIPFDETSLTCIGGPMTCLTAEESFNYTWLASLLDEVLAEVEKECRVHGLETHWRVFHDRVLAPILNETEPPPLSEVAGMHGVADCATASNMIVTVNRRLQTALRRQLRRHVSMDAMVEEELGDFLRMFCD